MTRAPGASPRRWLSSRHGERARLRGARNEQRVLDAVYALGLDWIVSARLSTLAEDREGSDVVVETTDGETLHLQVKSSHCGARKAVVRLLRSALRPTVLVAPDDLSDLHDRTHEALLRARLGIT